MSFALILFSVGMLLYGGNKTNIVLRMMRPLRMLSLPVAVTEAQRMIANWNTRGAYDNSFEYEFGGNWEFPFGTNHLASVEVAANGVVYESHFSTNIVVSAPVDVSIIPGVTQFSAETTVTGDYAFRWRNAVIDRNPNNLIDIDLELRRNGDRLVATNGVETLYRRVLPFEHDGFGQDDAWVAANFTNATEISVAGGYAAWVDAQVGHGLTNGLYKFTVSFATPPVEVVNLQVGDMTVAVVDAGNYSFVLEKGRLYIVDLSFIPTDISYSWDDGQENNRSARLMMSRPVNSPAYSVILTSSGDSGNGAEFTAPSRNSAGSIVYWPWLSIAPSNEVDPTFPVLLSATVFDIPQNTNPTISWISNGEVLETGENFYWYGNETEVDSISVEATYRDITLYGSVNIERHVRESEISISGVGIIFFEDAYTNSPGDVVSATSTTVPINLAWYLAEAGSLSIDCDCTGIRVTNRYGASIALPHTWHAAADEEDEWVLYAYSAGSDGTQAYNFTFTYTPDENGPTLTETASTQIVKIRVEAESTWPENRVRHVFGVNESYRVIATPGGIVYSGHASINPGRHDIPLAIGSSTHYISIQSIPPSSAIDFTFIREMTESDWIFLGKAPLTQLTPGAGYVAARRLNPDYVNFSEIVIKEGLAPVSNVQGCFLDEEKFPVSSYAHDQNAGANVVCGVTNMFNQINGEDCIGVQFGQIPDSAGSYSLNIPVYWGANSFMCTNYFSQTPIQVSVAPVPDGDDGAYLDTTITKENTSITRRCPDER